MPWYFPWSESIKKRACRYLLQHYLGDFLKEKLTLNQLTVDLYNGKGIVKNVPLDVWALNEMLDSLGIPLELIDGFIGSISVLVPWTTLLNDSCEVEINGLELTIAPRQKGDQGNMFDSNISWSSMNMTTSMQLAQECLKQDPSPGEEQAESAQTFEGLEAFAQTIESVLSRIKLMFNDTVFRLEHLPAESSSGVGLELHIDRIRYFDSSNQELGTCESAQHTVYEPVAIAIKNFHIHGVHLYMDEFPLQKRTRLKETLDSRKVFGFEHSPPSMQPKLAYRETSRPAVVHSESMLLPPLQILGSCGKQTIKLKLKQSDALPGPKVDVEYFLGALNVLLTPRQVHLLTEVLSTIPTTSGVNENPTKGTPQKPRMRMMGDEDYQRVEQALQQQIVDSSTLRLARENSWPMKTDEIRRVARSLSGDSDGDEFYSMNDFSLPALGQPPVTFVSTSPHALESGTYHSGISSLANVSLASGSFSGGPNNSLKSGSLAERANSVFKGSENSFGIEDVGKATGKGNYSNAPNSGLAGLSALDDTADLTHVKIRSGNVILILLHQEPLHTSHASELSKAEHSGGGEPTLVELSEAFFQDVTRYAMQGLFGSGAKEAREGLSSLCPFDHTRILLSAITAECENKLLSGGNSIVLDLVLGKLAADEFLFEKGKKKETVVSPYSHTKLLQFAIDEDNLLYPGGFGSSPAPCLKLKMTRTSKSRLSSSGVQSRGCVQPKSSVTVDLAKLATELDVTVIDRIAGLIWPGPLFQTSEPNAPSSKMFSSLFSNVSMAKHTCFNQIMDEGTVGPPEIKTDLEIRCPSLTVNVRFPVPDLRPASDIEKRPWWRKAIRKESLALDFSNFELRTSLTSTSSVSSYEARFKSCSGHFQTQSNTSLHVLEIGCLSSEENNTFGADYPRVCVSFCPLRARSVFEEAENEPKTSGSQFDSLEENWLKSEPSPFSARPAMYEKEELVMPGNAAEMNAFETWASLNALLQIDCFFPHLKANLMTKDIFELLYNRLFNDLVMWEPSAPAPIDSLVKSNMPPQGSIHINLASHVGLGMNDKFFMCRSAAREISGLDDSDDDSTSYGSSDFFAGSGKSAGQVQQSNSSVSISITRGELALFPDVKSDADGKSEELHEPGEHHQGHTVISVKDARLYCVSGYKGQPQLSYTHLYAMDACLHHRSYVDDTLDIRVMTEALCTTGLINTIYRSDFGVLSHTREGSTIQGESSPVLSLSVKSTLDESSNHRDNLIAVGLRGATMNYVVQSSAESWLTQIINFMDVTEYPVLGYTTPTVITVLHTHFWGCSVDYRPLYIPTKILLLIESLSISSNIVPKSSASILRFLVEDSSLYLSEKAGTDVNLDADYVCVMDMELFELALRVTDGSDMRQPKFDLSMSNNILNIRTCSDSCLALIKVIKYIATDGDLEEPTMQSPVLEQDSGSTQSLNVQSPQPKISVDEKEMNSLIGDAMKESKAESVSQNSSSLSEEDLQRLKFYNASPVKGVTTYVDESEEDITSDDEYCILETEKDNGEAQEEAEPVVRYFSEKPIVVKDDYFSVPLCRNDQMTAPSHFPTPEYRYAIKELSIIWQMYGGRDFAPSCESASPIQSSGSWPETFSATYYSNDRKHEQASCTGDHTRPHKLHAYETGLNYRRKTARVQGGPLRNLETLMELQMNKIRYQHDVYPEGSHQLSRDVLLVYDLEVRDRLSKSQINKFLYRFTSELYPKQTNANMLTIKMLITKPEDDVRPQEASLRVSIQPLRLNVDQDSLFFLKSFFMELTDETAGRRPRGPSLCEGRLTGGISPQGEPIRYFDQEFSDEDHFSRVSSSTPPAREARSTPDDASSLFFRSFIFSPDVPIRLDYHGKHIDMDQGTFTGLLIGLAQLNCSELKLKRLCCRSGLLGPDRVLAYCIHEWLMDIRKTQIPSILGGVGPAHSIVQLFQGLKDLFWMPVQQYKQDGRIVRGLQRGAHSFSTSTAMAVLELSNRLVMVIQAAAETAFDMVSPGPSVSQPTQQRRLYGRQPVDLREGVTNAYDVITKGITETTAAIVKVATEEHGKKGVSGAVGGVIRQIPPTVLQPIILATEATSNVLGGARNQLAPDARREAAEKWKSPVQ